MLKEAVEKVRHIETSAIERYSGVTCCLDVLFRRLKSIFLVEYRVEHVVLSNRLPRVRLFILDPSLYAGSHVAELGGRVWQRYVDVRHHVFEVLFASTHGMSVDGKHVFRDGDVEILFHLRIGDRICMSVPFLDMRDESYECVGVGVVCFQFVL